MAEPRLKGSEHLDSTERRRVLWGLVLKSIPVEGSIRFRDVEIVAEMLIKSVELRDPALAREWVYEKNTIIAFFMELDHRGIIVFARPKIDLGSVGAGEVDYEAATVARTSKTQNFLFSFSARTLAVMKEVPQGLLDLLAIAALEPP